MKSLYTLCLLLMIMVGATNANAQEKKIFAIDSFTQDQTDLTARDPKYQKKDGNGKRYAIIRVRSISPSDMLTEYDFNFGNMKHIVVEKEDELWVYVQKNAKTVTIKRKGYATLNRYDLHTTIAEGAVYIMTLAPEGIEIKEQELRFNVTPSNSNATVTICQNRAGAEEETFGTADTYGVVAGSLKHGTYTYRVTARNYLPSEGRIVLRDDKEHVESVTLTPNFGTVTLEVDADAEILVDKESMGRRSWTGPLEAGEHQVECHMKYHDPSIKTITVSKDEDSKTKQKFVLDKPTPQYGTISVKTYPEDDAKIMIDGKDFGHTPKNIKLTAGKHKVEVSKKNFRNATREVEVVDGPTQNVDITMSTVAHVVIDSKPSGASLTLNGESVGKTPYEEDLDPGEYTVILDKYKYNRVEKKVHIDILHSNFKLRMHKSWFFKSDAYLHAGYQFGKQTGIDAQLGFYMNRFNLEFFGTRLMKEIDLPDADNLKPWFVGARIGWGITLRRFRVTPQAGIGTLIGARNGDYNFNTNLWCYSGGLKMEFALNKHFSLVVTPRYRVAMKKKGDVKLYEEESTVLKGWTKGFDIQTGLSLNF